MKLVVGLGNPGKKYEGSRHNVGFQVLDSLGLDWQLMTKASALVAKETHTRADGKKTTVLYAKPQTFMNLSGAAVLALQQFYKIPTENILVVYDDKDLPIGTVRFRDKGSSGGQNGIGNIITVLGTAQIARVKVGVAPQDADQPLGDTAKYVLNRFSREQEELLPEVMDQARQAIITWLNA